MTIGLDLPTLAAMILLVMLPVWDWAVAIRLVRAARVRPHIDILTASAATSVSVALSATIAAVIAINRLIDAMPATGSFLPRGSIAPLLTVALILMSLPNIWKNHVLRRIVGRPVRHVDVP